MGVSINEAGLEQALTRLEQARTWSPRVVSRLETLIRTAEDLGLFRINPIQYAADRQMDEHEAIDLFLHGTKAGLFELQWHLVCAFCGHVVDSLGDLSGVHAHYKCTFCEAENDAALDDYIQVTFTVSPHLRPIRFHQPEQLEIQDYYFNFHFAKGLKPFPNGMTLQQMAEVITRYMKYVEPREQVVIEADVPPGMLQAKDLRHRASLVLFLQEPKDGVEALRIHLADRAFRAEDRTLVPRTVHQTVATFRYDSTDALERGKVRIEYTNLMDTPSALWLVHFPAGFESTYLGFHPFLSGKRLLTTQTFRDLFRTETLGINEGIAVKDITFLFTDLKGSTDLYDRIGDLNAYYLVRQHFDTLTSAITDNHGSIVKTIGDAVMATFMTPADAAQAALRMLRGLDEFNETISQPLHLKVGIHRGASIAVTLNDRVDYFGQAVNMAARIQGLAGANEIYISHSTHDDPDVKRVFDECDAVEEDAVLKSVSGNVDVCGITLH
jgi:class 3 adenylate cyclase